MDHLGKDIRTVSSGGVGDSAEVYEMRIMKKTDSDLDNKIIEKYSKLSAERKRQFDDFVDFLIWREQKRKANLNLETDDDN